MMRNFICAFVLLASLPAAAAKEAAKASGPKQLAELNALTKLLVPAGAPSTEELENIVEVSEIVGPRDATRSPSPMAIVYAGTLERALATPGVKSEHGERALVELALALAPFGGPQADAQVEGFYPALLASQNIKPEDGQPRMALPVELAEIGQWAVATVTRLLPRLPAAQADLVRVRLQLTRGQYREAAELSRKHLAGATPDPHWQARLASALIQQGKAAEATPYIAAAQAAGGEAARIIRSAQLRRSRELLEARTPKLLVAAHHPPSAEGPRGRALLDACKALLSDDKAQPGGAAGEAAVACAGFVSDDASRDWLGRVAQLSPTGADGAPARATYLVRTIFGMTSAQKKTPPTAEERQAAFKKYLGELDLIKLEPNEHRIYALLGHMGLSPTPTNWAPSDEAKKLLAEIETQTPCDPVTFPLRALAVRSDRLALGNLLDSVVRRCAEAPGGAAITVDAVTLLLQLAHEVPSPVPAAAETLEPLVQKFVRAHGNEAEAVGAHADAVALKALAGGHAPQVALEAALSRYEDAMTHWTPAGSPVVRQRLAANAGYLSLALARLANEKSAERRDKFYQRAMRHLRFALAFGDVPALVATRAAFDLDQKIKVATVVDLSRTPPGQSRARATCMQARQAYARDDASAAKKLLDLATVKAPHFEPAFDVPELLVDTTGTFSILLEDRTLRPYVELKPAIYLAPPCDPATVKPEK